MSWIDLHIHSSASDDGEFSAEEIVVMCRERGIKLAAVTDHNSVRSVKAAMEGAGDGLTILSGVELDCTCRGRNFHLLGYQFDYTKKVFAEIERDILEQEKSAANEKIRLFREAAGITLDSGEVLRAAEGGVVTGELIAEIVLGKKDAAKYAVLHPYLPGGDKSDMPNVRFYWDFFSEGKPAYVPIRYLSLGDAVSLLHDAGGIAVLAHPGQNLSGEEDSLFTAVAAEGIDGIEAYSSYHSRGTAEHYAGIAGEHRLLVTCGSDFHGKHKPRIELGGHGAVQSDEELFAGIKSML